jgi:endo-1,4-beta-D-glucanase Y
MKKQSGSYTREGRVKTFLCAMLLMAVSASAVHAYPCASSMAPDQSAANAELQNSYNAWKSAYVTAAGAGGFLRVQRPGNNYDTVSEGVAYGMIFAAYMNDRPTFDGLWQYAKSHLNGGQPGHHGLMAWHVDQNNNVLDWTSATDADEDMAFALILADKKWGGYGPEATDLIGKIMSYEVEAGTFVLKPGDVWGGSTVTNPSYFTPAFYKLFKAYTGDAGWDSVTNKAYQVIAAVNGKTGAGTTGLQPDWTTAGGDQVVDAQGNRMSFDYTYDATRVPWRLATDAAWYCDSRAVSQLDKLNTFFRNVGAANIRDGYRLDGTLIGQWHNAAFVAPAAAGAIMSGDSAYRSAMWNETVGLRNSDYYGDSLRLLSLLLMSGNMTNPLESTGAGAGGNLVLDDFESGNVGKWTAFGGSGSSLTYSAASPGRLGNYAMNVQYSVTSWAGVSQGYLTGQNWSAYQSFDFWFYGNNTGNTIRLEVSDNRAAGGSGDTSERFEYKFVDNASGWRHFSVPWASFQRRPDWQPAGAPNDGFTLTQVWGFDFAPITGAGSFRLDQVELVNRTYAVLDDFEAGNTTKWNTFGDPGSIVSPGITSGKVGSYAMSVQYAISSWGGLGQGYTAPRDWSGYQAFEFWFYGNNTSNTIRLEVSDNRPAGSTTDNSERYEYKFTDNFSGWRYISVPWASFQRRGDWQPTGAPNDGFTLTQIWGISLAPITGAGGFQLDQVQLMK